MDGYHHQGRWILLDWLFSLHPSFVTTLWRWLVARWHAPTCTHPKCVCDCCMYFGLSIVFHLPWRCSSLEFAWSASLIIIWRNSSHRGHAMHLSKRVSLRYKTCYIIVVVVLIIRYYIDTCGDGYHSCMFTLVCYLLAPIWSSSWSDHGERTRIHFPWCHLELSRSCHHAVRGIGGHFPVSLDHHERTLNRWCWLRVGGV